MQISVDDFKLAMRQLPACVTVVTSRSAGEMSAITVSAVASLTAEPPRLLACVNVSGRAFRVISEARMMGVNVLAQHHEDLAKSCAAFPGVSPPDLQDGSWDLGDGSPPLLKDARVAFDCTVQDMFVSHTHAIVIGLIRRAIVNADSLPLMYGDGQFCTLSQPAAA